MSHCLCLATRECFFSASWSQQNRELPLGGAREKAVEEARSANVMPIMTVCAPDDRRRLYSDALTTDAMTNSHACAMYVS